MSQVQFLLLVLARDRLDELDSVNAAVIAVCLLWAILKHVYFKFGLQQGLVVVHYGMDLSGNVSCVFLG